MIMKRMITSIAALSVMVVFTLVATLPCNIGASLYRDEPRRIGVDEYFYRIYNKAKEIRLKRALSMQTHKK